MRANRARSLCWIAVAACSPACERADRERVASASWFAEDGERSGLSFRHVAALEQRFDFPEIMGSGLALFDYDGDGDLDLYCVQSGDLVRPDDVPAGGALYANRGDGTFEDVTARAGLRSRGYGMGCACGDYDGDGDVDLYLTNVGPNVLYENRGDGSFRDVSAAAGVADPAWSTSAAFVDFDADGRLDLLVANYIRWSRAIEQPCFFREQRRDYCHPQNYGAPARSTLLRNLDGGRFEDVTESAGLGRAVGNGLGLACGDFDGDGGVDLFVANDMTANHLWSQTGERTFAERGLIAGCALSGHGGADSGMGAQACDVDDDGDLDLFVSHLRGQGHVLFVNEHGVFEDRTARAGLLAPGLADTGFGLGFADFDHDADLDLFVANGHVIVEEPFADPADPYAQPSRLLEQIAPGEFAAVAAERFTSPPLVATSRGAALGDLDGDGDVDIVVANRNARPHLLRNQLGPQRNWVMFRVLGASGGDAIGARVRIRAGDREQWRLVDPAYGYCSSNDPRVHFGLGDAALVDEVLVIWPDGARSTFEQLAARRVHELRRAR